MTDKKTLKPLTKPLDSADNKLKPKKRTKKLTKKIVKTLGVTEGGPGKGEQGQSSQGIHILGATNRDSDRLKTVAIQFGQRLKYIRTENTLTQKEMAASLHLNLLTYGRYENGTRLPDADICAQIVMKYRVDSAWLLFGDSAEGMANKESLETAKNYKAINVYEMADASHENTLTMEIPTESITVPKSMLHKDLVAVIYREGNMYPYITPGAVVGINKKVKDAPMGHVYAVWTSSDGTRLYRAYAKSLTETSLRSDNHSIPDIVIDNKDFKNAILGRVEWLFQAC